MFALTLVAQASYEGLSRVGRLSMGRPRSTETAPPLFQKRHRRRTTMASVLDAVRTDMPIQLQTVDLGEPCPTGKMKKNKALPVPTSAVLR